jgi:hypothetical protein
MPYCLWSKNGVTIGHWRHHLLESVISRYPSQSSVAMLLTQWSWEAAASGRGGLVQGGELKGTGTNTHIEGDRSYGATLEVYSRICQERALSAAYPRFLRCHIIFMQKLSTGTMSTTVWLNGIVQPRFVALNTSIIWSPPLQLRRRQGWYKYISRGGYCSAPAVLCLTIFSGQK